MPPKREQPPRASKTAHSVLRKRSSPSDTTGDQKRPTTEASPSPSVAPSSSSSSAAPPAPAVTTKYYFIPASCRSYTLDELWTINDSFRAQASPFPTTHCAVVAVKFPCGANFQVYTWDFTERANARRANGEVPKCFCKSALIDWSRTSGQTECALTTEAFQEPVLLNANGRCYDGAALKSAIACTLMQGENLRLEDITLTPVHSGSLVIYPNYSLPGWDPKSRKVSSMTVAIPNAKVGYDGAKILSRNVPSVAALFDKLPLSADGYTQSFAPLLEAYRRHSSSTSNIVQHLGVSRAVFPRSYLKLDSVVLHNIFFKSCVFYLNCWRHLCFVGCRFESCIFIVSSQLSEFDVRVCEEHNSIWVAQFKAPVHYYSFNDAIAVRDSMNFMRSVNTRIVRVDPDTFTGAYMRTATHAAIEAHPVIHAGPYYRLSDK